MTNAKNIIIGSVLLAALLLNVYTLIEIKAVKTAFVYNEKLFQGFDGTKALQQELKSIQNQHQKKLDSLITADKSASGMKAYEEESRRLNVKFENLSRQYTADIWKRINEYVAEYGKDKQINFIMGASGDGGLMYAAEARNITKEVIDHMNSKYQGNE